MAKSGIISELLKRASRSQARIPVVAGGYTPTGLFVWSENKLVDPDPRFFGGFGKPFSLHAEMGVLITLIKKNLTLDNLYVVAPKRRPPGFRPSKPCPRCLHFLKESGRVKRITYFDGTDWVTRGLQD